MNERDNPHDGQTTNVARAREDPAAATELTEWLRVVVESLA